VTQTGAKPARAVKTLTIAPLCSLDEAKKRFEDRLLDAGHVNMRFTESVHMVSAEGETKILFLKNVLPQAIVSLGWQTLRTLKFSAAKHSRRKALNYSGSVGGEVLFGWIDFAKRARGVVPIPTSATREMWPQFRKLWYVLYFVQYFYHAYLPEQARLQMAKAKTAYGSLAGSVLDWLDIDTKTDTEREEYREILTELERDFPDDFNKIVETMLIVNHPEYADQLQRAMQAEEACGMKVFPQLGIADGELMAGYTIPGTMFSTVTVNRTALFRAHEDGNNLPGGLACLAAFGDFAGGDLCFPRFGVSCALEPGDLLIADTNREQHGNIGPLSGERISIVAYMRDDFVK
jgi:hypothetical protein